MSGNRDQTKDQGTTRAVLEGRHPLDDGPTNWLGHRVGTGSAKIDEMLLTGAMQEQMEEARGAVETHLYHLQKEHGLPLTHNDGVRAFDREALGAPPLDGHPGHPEEVDAGGTYREGAVRQVVVNAYERDTGARRRCLEHYGSHCSICEMSFGARYGPLAEGFIHVHHLKPLSEIREEYKVDPIADLRPVCPNCHAVIHMAKQCHSIDEVKKLLLVRRVGQDLA